MNKNHIVCFSGGLDSTYLVNKLLKQGDNVKIVYIEIENNGNKTIREKKAVEYFFNYFDKKYPNKIKKSKTISKTISEYNCQLELNQPILFLTSLLYSIDDNTDTINIGYVLNDDAISFIDDIKSIYYSHQPLFKRKLPLIDFPLTKLHKVTMISELYNEHGKEFMDNITFCENVYDYDNCGECVPCKRFMRSIADYDCGYTRKFINYNNVNYGDILNQYNHYTINMFHDIHSANVIKLENQL